MYLKWPQHKNVLFLIWAIKKINTNTRKSGPRSFQDCTRTGHQPEFGHVRIRKVNMFVSTLSHLVSSCWTEDLDGQDHSSSSVTSSTAHCGVVAVGNHGGGMSVTQGGGTAFWSADDSIPDICWKQTLCHFKQWPVNSDLPECSWTKHNMSRDANYYTILWTKAAVRATVAAVCLHLSLLCFTPHSPEKICGKPFTTHIWA